MDDTLSPIHPGEVLLEDFMKPLGLTQYRLAHDIEVIAMITNEEHTFLSSTTVREIASLDGNVTSMVPPHVALALKNRFKELGDGQQIVQNTTLRD